MRIVFCILLFLALPARADDDKRPLPERDARQAHVDDMERRVKLLRLEAEEAELRQRIARATGDTSNPTTTAVPVLTAILVTDAGAVAYFQDGKRTVRVRKGEHIGPWVVRAFLGNAVRLEHSESGDSYLAAIGAKSPDSTHDFGQVIENTP